MRWRFLLAMVLLAALLADVSRSESLPGMEALEQGRFDLAIDALRPVAESGNPAAQYRLGLMQLYAMGTARDPKGAVLWLTRAAEQGHLPAQLDLAGLHLAGEALPADAALAAKWHRAAADQGSLEGLYRLGLQFDRGQGMPIDYQQASRLFRQAARAGHPPAERRLGQYHAAGLGTDLDLAAALALLTKASEAGDAEAAFELLGEALAKNDRAAQELYVRTARWAAAGIAAARPDAPESNESRAFCLIAFVGRAFEDAAQRCRPLAEAGQPTALYVLAQLAEGGLGQPANPGEAARLHAFAAEGGIARAANALARLLLRGQDARLDETQAARLVALAAARGYVPAMFNLGFLHDSGTGLPKDARQALDWYRRAAELGHARAQYNLASLLYRGLGAPRDLSAAYTWFRLAGIQQGVDRREGRELARLADEGRAHIAPQLPPAAIAAAEERARAFRPRPAQGG